MEKSREVGGTANCEAAEDPLRYVALTAAADWRGAEVILATVVGLAYTAVKLDKLLVTLRLAAAVPEAVALKGGNTPGAVKEGVGITCWDRMLEE